KRPLFCKFLGYFSLIKELLLTRHLLQPFSYCHCNINTDEITQTVGARTWTSNTSAGKCICLRNRYSFFFCPVHNIIHRLCTDAVGYKARYVVCNNDTFAEFIFCKELSALYRLFCSILKRNNFNQLHNARRIEKVHAEKSFPFIILEYFSDIFNRNTRGVCCK